MRDGTRIYIKLIHVVVQQKQTHYKAIILQLKIMELDLDIALKMGFFQYMEYVTLLANRAIDTLSTGIC